MGIVPDASLGIPVPISARMNWGGGIDIGRGAPLGAPLPVSMFFLDILKICICETLQREISITKSYGTEFNTEAKSKGRRNFSISE